MVLADRMINFQGSLKGSISGISNRSECFTVIGIQSPAAGYSIFNIFSKVL